LLSQKAHADHPADADAFPRANGDRAGDALTHVFSYAARDHRAQRHPFAIHGPGRGQYARRIAHPGG
jgi:hypothetical protein